MVVALSPSSLNGGVDGDETAYNKMYSLASNKVITFKKRPPPPPCSSEGSMKVVGSSHGWLASFNIDNRRIFLSNPITNRHILLPKLPDFLSRPDKIILTSSPDLPDCRAVIMSRYCGMGLWCPDTAEWNLFGGDFYKDCVYSSRHNRLFCTTLYHHDTEETLASWDLTDPNSPSKDWHLERGHHILGHAFWREGKRTKSEEERNRSEGDGVLRDVKYLVFAEESDQLFLVTRYVMEAANRDGSFADEIHPGPNRGFGASYPYKTFAFDVYEVDREGDKLRYVEDGSLNGFAMFVGSNHGFALRAADYPELKPDSIYFSDDEEFTPPAEWNSNYGGHDIGIYNYGERSFSSIYYSCDASHFTRILPPPIWFTPNPHPHLN